MIAFTVWGFIAEGGKYLNFKLDVFAESPSDATDRIMAQYCNLVVSGVSRASRGKLIDY